MNKLLFLIICLLCTLTASAQGEYDTPADVAQGMLKTLEGSKGAERNWEVFRSYFVTEARITLLSKREDSTFTRHLTVEEFIQAAGANYKKNGFYEYEITEPLVLVYGHTATVWQPYGIRFEPEGEEIMRGINIYHLLKVNGKWLVAFLTWQTEEEDYPVMEWRG